MVHARQCLTSKAICSQIKRGEPPVSAVLGYAVDHLKVEHRKSFRPSVVIDGIAKHDSVSLLTIVGLTSCDEGSATDAAEGKVNGTIGFF